MFIFIIFTGIHIKTVEHYAICSSELSQTILGLFHLQQDKCV